LSQFLDEYDDGGPAAWLVSIDDSHLAELVPLFEDGTSKEEQSEEKAIYRTALQELRDAFAYSYSFSPDGICSAKKWSALRWPVSIREDFMKCLTEAKPEALVLLAYECVLLRREPPCWYMVGHASLLMSTIKDNLDAKWSSYIEWPANVVGGDRRD
jgi:hypothetical protein